MYLPSATELRPNIAGQQHRASNAFSAADDGPQITIWQGLDFTKFTYAEIYRLMIARTTGQTSYPPTANTSGLLDGTFAPNISTLFALAIAMFANGGGGSALDGSISELSMDWGGADFVLPPDLMAPQFSNTFDWGGNAQLVSGIAPQRYYAGTLDEWNGGVINRSRGRVTAMLRQRTSLTRTKRFYPYTVLP